MILCFVTIIMQEYNEPQDTLKMQKYYLKDAYLQEVS